MIRKKIGEQLDAPVAIYRTIQEEFGVTRQTVKNAFTFRSYSELAQKIRDRAIELGALVVDHYIWVKDEYANTIQTR